MDSGLDHVCQASYQQAEQHISLSYDPASYSLVCWCPEASSPASCVGHAGKPSAAWELYLQQEATQQSLQLLHLIANECYQAGFFFPAARAFDVLEHLHPAALYGQAKQGACVGTLQMVIAGKESADSLR